MQTAKKKKERLAQERRALLDEYYTTLSRMESLRRAFEQITDHALIAACVFEMNAAQQKYSYLLGRLREKEITSPPILRSVVR